VWSRQQLPPPDQQLRCREQHAAAARAPDGGPGCDGETECAEDQGQGTPVCFINGRALFGTQPFATFQKIIEEELKK
jgi:hypothetical protein